MFVGRIDRKGFAIGYLFAYGPLIIFAAAVLVARYAFNVNFGDPDLRGAMLPIYVVLVLYLIAFFYPVVIGLSIRRLHDMGHSGWWSVLQLASTISLIAAVVQMLYPGSTEPNRYGDPASPRTLKGILFNPITKEEVEARERRVQAVKDAVAQRPVDVPGTPNDSRLE